MRPCLALIAVLTALEASAQIPQLLGYQGRLLHADGSPVTGAAQLRFALYSAETGGTLLWSETQRLGLSDGYYATFLGQSYPDAGAQLEAHLTGDAWLEVQVGPDMGSFPFEILSPRQRVASVAYALHAKNLSGGTVDATSISVNGTTVVGSDGKLAGAAAYAAGPGLALTNGAFGINAATCTGAQQLQWTGAAWSCVPVTSYAAGDGLSLDGGVFAINASGCTSGQVLTFSGTAWGCTTPASYTAGNGLALNGTAFSLATSGCSNGQVWRFNGSQWACAAPLTTGPGLNLSTAGNLTLTKAPADYIELTAEQLVTSNVAVATAFNITHQPSSASAKVVLTLSTGYSILGGNSGYVYLFRDGVNVHGSTGVPYWSRVFYGGPGSGAELSALHLTMIDTPNTTNTVHYQVWIAVDTNSGANAFTLAGRQLDGVQTGHSFFIAQEL